ncbi:MAG: phosphoenolpyruvate--protein phosphotransferase, partial [Nitrospinota bacterium]
MGKEGRKVDLLKGIPVSEGIAIGKIFILDKSGPKIRKENIEKKHIEKEIDRFLNAVLASKNQLLEIKRNEAGKVHGDYSFIIDTHIMMIEDSFLTESTVRSIKTNLLNAEWTLKESINSFIVRFDKINDEYMNERKRDVEHVGNRILHNLIGSRSNSLLQFDEPVVVIAYDLSASDTAQMRKEKVLGFATDVGGRTSHTGIIASALGIPAIVGLNDVSTSAQNGDAAIIDGNNGVVHLNPEKETLEEYKKKKRRFTRYKKEQLKTKQLEAITKDGTALKLMANIEYTEELAEANKMGAMGVGLFRSEFLYLSQLNPTSEHAHFLKYRELAEKTLPYPAIVRTIDSGGDKILPCSGATKEPNPSLGLRGIRFCLNNPGLFKTQLRAILRASAYGKLKIMYPMITGIEEVLAANQLVKVSMEELSSEGLPFDEKIEIGAMIETPSAALIIEELSLEVDFFSIGTNDLIQYTLAIDRINEKVAYLYRPYHPAILKTIRFILSKAESANTPISICGMLGGDPLFIMILLGLGKIESLSMAPASISCVKRLIRKIS